MKYLLKKNKWDVSKKYNIDKILYLLIDSPDEISSINDFIWKNVINQINRDYDLPAVHFKTTIHNTEKLTWFTTHIRQCSYYLE